MLCPFYFRHFVDNDDELSDSNAKDRTEPVRLQNWSSQKPSADTLWLSSVGTNNWTAATAADGPVKEFRFVTNQRNKTTIILISRFLIDKCVFIFLSMRSIFIILKFWHLCGHRPHI